MDYSDFFDYGAGGQPDAQPAAPLFLANLPPEGWTRFLSVARRRAFTAGEVIVNQGETSREFYIVSSGRLEVVVPEAKGGERHVYFVEPMSIFGEQAFFDGLPRSATVRALSEGALFGVTPDAFEVLSARFPDLTRLALFDLGRILSLRLREMTQFALNGN
jgi:CRP/FNR family transcriptional regulator, cyclic AMP receptor protein